MTEMNKSKDSEKKSPAAGQSASEEPSPLPPSRSALKRAAKAVEELAERLAELSPSRLARLSPPREIAAELKLVTKAAGHGGARKRQVKHLAGLLRREPDWTETLREFLEGTDARHYQEQQRFHQLEALRDRLCDPAAFPAALEEARTLFPAVDGDQLSHLSASFRSSGDKRAFREIFQLLKAVSETPRE